jgi:hypothetical protein
MLSRVLESIASDVHAVSLQMFQFSRCLAIVAGFALPVLETVRRWRQLNQPAVWPFWLDDWAIGGFLLYGAWRTARRRRGGRPMLAAAWGFACGLAYVSFFSQVAAVAEPDPSGLNSLVMIAIKGVMFVLAIVALAGALRAEAPPEP